VVLPVEALLSFAGYAPSFLVVLSVVVPAPVVDEGEVLPVEGVALVALLLSVVEAVSWLVPLVLLLVLVLGVAVLLVLVLGFERSVPVCAIAAGAARAIARITVGASFMYFLR
jgi:hypothetical protein